MTVLPLEYVRLRVTAQVERPIRLNAHAGSALRGAIGDAMRWHHCVTDLPGCADCPVFNQCSFGPVWRPAADEHGSPPPPYLISPPPWQPGGRRYATGETFQFAVTLFGWARTRVGAFVDAIRNALGHQIGGGSARMTAVEIDDRLVSDVDGRLRLGLLGQALCIEERGGWRTPVTLDLRTPWQSQTSDGELARFEPHRFTEHLLLRIEQLCRRYGTGALPIGRDELCMQARTARVIDDETRPVAFERQSNRQGRRIPMQGRVGRVRVDNVTRPVRALWRLAEITHAGKKAALGFGAVHVEEGV